MTNKEKNRKVKANLYRKDAFLEQQETKQKEKRFFKDLKHRDLNKTPVFLSFITLIVLSNFIIFFLLLAKKSIGFGELDSAFYPLLFGANHASSIIQGKQIWRLFLFVFVENNAGFFTFFISMIFVWLSFYQIGFLQEIFFGSKKTITIWGVGIFILGLSQFALTRNEAVHYYGSDYLSWIVIGAMTYLLLNNSIKNEQAQALIKSKLLKVVFVLIIFSIIKFVNIKNSIQQDNELLKITGFYIAFPVLAFVLGYSLSVMCDYKKVKSIIAVYSVTIFFVLFILIILALTLWSLTSFNLGQESWNKIKDFY